MKLYFKFLIFILVLMGMALWASIYFSSRAVTDAISLDLSNSAYADATKNINDFRKALASGREGDGLKALYAFQQRSGVICAGLIRSDGSILAHTNVALSGTKAELGWVPKTHTGSLSYRRTLYKDEETVEVLIPLSASGDLSNENVLFGGGSENNHDAGSLWAILSLKQAKKAEKEIVFKLLLRTILILFVALVISGIFMRFILQQVGFLSEGLRKVREGDMSWKVRVNSRDEVGELAVFFNEMMCDLAKSKAVIEEYQKNLERKVEERTIALEKAQAHLLQASKMAAIGKMVSGVAHELNNPLAGIRGYAQVMKSDGGLSAQQNEDLDIIITQSGRAREIIRSLLLFSRKSEPKTEVVGIPELLDEVLKLVNYEPLASGIEVVRDIPPALPPVLGDRALLQQVFLNIIGNASDAMARDKGGKLYISAGEADGKNIIIKFTDSGPGISKENLERIFDPFFTTKPTGKGTGLGLSISYEIIKNHNGNLSAENGPGRGATFIIELPSKK